MADTLWSGRTDDKLYLQSGQFTSTIKDSEGVGSVDNTPVGISWDGSNAPWVGSEADKLYLQSGQFTSTIKTSQSIGAIDIFSTGVSFDNVDTPWVGSEADKLYLQSGQFTSTLKTSEFVGVDTSAHGISWDGTNTPWIGRTDVKLYLQSGQFTSTLKTSEFVGGVDTSPFAISWDGTNTPWQGFTATKLYLQSGQFTSTLKTSQSIGAVDSLPDGIEHGDFDARVPAVPLNPSQPAKHRTVRIYQVPPFLLSGTFTRHQPTHFIPAPAPSGVSQPARHRTIRPMPFEEGRFQGAFLRRPKILDFTFTPSVPAVVHPINPVVVRTTDGTWLFTWAVDTAPYDIWLEGNLIESGLTSESFEYLGGEFPDEAPPIEVVPAGSTPENQIYPPRFQLQWRGNQSAAAYVVQRLIDAVWTDVANITENGAGYYLFTSDALADVEEHQLRVIALDLASNKGTPLTFTSIITRNPDTPDVSIDLVGNIVVVS